MVTLWSSQWNRKYDSNYRSTIQNLSPPLSLLIISAWCVCFLSSLPGLWNIRLNSRLNWRVRQNMTCKQCSAKIGESCQIVCYASHFLKGQNGHDKAISTLSAFPWQPQWAYLSPRLIGLQHSNKGGVLRQTCGCRTWGNGMESGVYQTKWLRWLEQIADKAYKGNKRNLWLIIHELCRKVGI